MIYIREAHATDGWSLDTGWSILSDARSASEREGAASRACSLLQLPFSVVTDTMDDAVATRWSAWPERLFVVGTDGQVAYVGEQGPWGFWPRRATAPHGWGQDHGYSHGEPLDEFLVELLG